MKVSALFSDYDGTLASLGVPRSRSRVPARLESVLRRLAAQIPVAVITNKDCAFAKPRTDFAWAWSCSGGLEIILADGQSICPSSVPDTRLPYEMAKRSFGDGVVIERKNAVDGRVLGFSIDWTAGRKPASRKVFLFSEKLRKMGLHVVRDPSESFVDVYALRPDKGAALKKLCELLRVRCGVMYLGDTVSDNPAFNAADISISVDHGQRTAGLECEYAIRSSSLAPMLTALLRSSLEFEAVRGLVTPL